MRVQEYILPVVLLGCETWFLTLREEHKLRVFVWGPKRDEVMEGWRKLHNEELHNLYFSQRIIRMIESRRMRWDAVMWTGLVWLRIGAGGELL
jgi:hypothetical protein